MTLIRKHFHTDSSIPTNSNYYEKPNLSAACLFLFVETLFISRCHNDKTNLSEYALYKWHHPEGNVPYDTSDLVVACESDPDRFVIELKSEGDSPTLTG